MDPKTLHNHMRHVLRRAIRETNAPGAVLYIGDIDHTHLHIAEGLRQRVPEQRRARTDTLYDLASLTKVIATAPAIMALRDDGKLDLDQPVTDFIPIPAFRPLTLRNLMTHTAGLVPVERYFETMTTLEEIFHDVSLNGIDHPPGVEHLYSDVGFMLLGRIVELAAQDSLDAYCKKRIFDPLGMTRTAFRPPRAWWDNCAPTEMDSIWRNQLVHGSVHDENAHAVGGVAGHAGLFSTAEDIARFLRGFLTGKVLRIETARETIAFPQLELYPWQGLGWQLDPWIGKKAGFLPARKAFGHTGWTGTSIWTDPDTGLFAILLSNTCHPSRKDRDNETFRRMVYSAAADEFYATTNAHTGLDRLVRENFVITKKKCIAVLTNHAGVDMRSRHLVDLLDFSPDTTLKYIYSPEHGFRGQAEAGEKVRGQKAPAPVISLYGEQSAPQPEQLRDVDIMLIDLQDIGARYYTYMATMKRCLAACAAARVPVVVLDRPNPLGGIVLEGSIATRADSLVCSARIPIRHGMTMGELALFFAKTELAGSRLDLRINLLDGWQPCRLFHECSLPWVPPSPNIPTPETALLYVGTCLFEGTNLNEGRGTDTPFALVGAPWLDAQSVIDDITAEERSGCELAATTYTPRAIPGKASNPRFADTPCQGIRISITDPPKLRAYTLAVAMIASIVRRHPLDFAWDGVPSFDLLAGGPALREAIEAGDSAKSIVRSHRSELRRFDRDRPRLYDELGVAYEPSVRIIA